MHSSHLSLPWNQFITCSSFTKQDCEMICFMQFTICSMNPEDGWVHLKTYNEVGTLLQQVLRFLRQTRFGLASFVTSSTIPFQNIL